MSSTSISAIPDTYSIDGFPHRVGGRIPSLDGLRAVAIVVVIVSHLFSNAHGLPWVGLRFYHRFSVGDLGVRLFFVISGFLITSLLLHEQQDKGQISLRRFYVRRAMRILPASYTFLLIMGLATVTGIVKIPRESFLASFLFVRNYIGDSDWYTGHLWSLSVEEQFYLIWPAIMVLCRQRQAVFVAVGALLLADLMRCFGHGGSFIGSMDALAGGCILACIWGFLGRNEPWQQFLRSPLFWAIPVIIVSSHPLWRLGSWLSAASAGIANILMAVLVERFVRYPWLGASRLLNSRPAVAVGTLSYSLYIWQQPWVHYIDGCLQIIPINIVFICGCAFISHKFVELPFLRLRDHWKTS